MHGEGRWQEEQEAEPRSPKEYKVRESLRGPSQPQGGSDPPSKSIPPCGRPHLFSNLGL